MEKTDFTQKIYVKNSKQSSLFFKRFFDIVFSFLVLIFFSPILLLIAICIKITSKGKVFYTQERISIDNRTFNIYKFRTMQEEAEKLTGPIFADDNDPRCTKIGLILRKISLDEFPQFFNVLLGDMSIVGPRPERPFYVEQFKKEIENYNERHKVKSGITGLAQIEGLRGKTSIEIRTKYDLEYVDNQSFLLDLEIISKTLSLVIKDFFKLLKKIF
jgi:exopolysaccharide biosynthesis polyprenyl glycosylphosphotransferase